MATSVHFDDAVQLVTALPPDPRSALILNGYLDSDRLIGLAQPTVWSDYGLATAQKALEAAHAALFNARYLADLTTTNRLKRAVAAANEIVLAANLAGPAMTTNHESVSDWRSACGPAAPPLSPSTRPFRCCSSREAIAPGIPPANRGPAATPGYPVPRSVGHRMLRRRWSPRSSIIQMRSCLRLPMWQRRWLGQTPIRGVPHWLAIR